MQAKTKQTIREIAFPLLGFLTVFAAVLFVAKHTNAQLLSHSAFDSYTKQAMAWRTGRIALDQNYPWLELAIYEGQYYVSFPPIPAIPMWLLSFIFGEETPSAIVTLCYFFLGLAAVYRLARRYLSAGQATTLTVFVALGGSILDIAVSGEGFSGGVWFQAQLMGFMFTALAFLLVDGKRRWGWAVGLVCIALAVGCRPFNALYVPVLLWMLFQHTRRISAMIPYIIIPGLIAIAYGAYNYARFGNPLEFGHAYLPELEQAGEGMFVLSRLGDNIRNILRTPYLSQGGLLMPITSGFAFYLTNPMILSGAERSIERATRHRADVTDLILGVSILLHALLLLTHRTNGGWQYGTRYLCDLLPALVFLACRGAQPLRRWETALMGALVMFNVYGSIVFHWL